VREGGRKGWRWRDRKGGREAAREGRGLEAERERERERVKEGTHGGRERVEGVREGNGGWGEGGGGGREEGKGGMSSRGRREGGREGGREEGIHIFIMQSCRCTERHFLISI
jgi:hypothetical protein